MRDATKITAEIPELVERALYWADKGIDGLIGQATLEEIPNESGQLGDDHETQVFTNGDDDEDDEVSGYQDGDDGQPTLYDEYNGPCGLYGGEDADVFSNDGGDWDY